MTCAIELRDVSYRYKTGDHDCLQGLNLRIEKGSFAVLMGAAGAGKTTLSLLLNGLIPQLLEGELRGKVVVAGHDVSEHRVQALARHVGLVLQDPESQIFGSTVEEDVAFGLKNFNVPTGELERRIQEALHRVGLVGYDQRLTATLSGGEKQRLAIAGMLALEPEILVLDEPAAELDPVGRAEVYQVLDHLRRDKGLTLLVIEHAPEEVMQLADYVLVLQDGKLAWQGEPSELSRQIPLLKRYGIRPLPTAAWGYALYEQGLISWSEIPLTLAQVERIASRLSEEQRRWAQESLRQAADYRRGFGFHRGANFSRGNYFPRDADLGVASSQGMLDSKKAEAGRIGHAYPAQEPLIVIRGLHHGYAGGVQALRGIDLDICPGEFVALVGQNGAGKTTLAKHLNALLRPSEGQVFIAGKDTRNSETGELAQTIGFLFQNPDHQIFASTVEQELAYGLRNVGLNEEEIRERVDKALEDTQLTQSRGIHPFSLGKGERQLIALASVLALKPSILVVDEPTTGLDWQGTLKMMELIRILHQNGTTVVMVAHDLELVARYAERVVVMKEGRVFVDGPVSEIFSRGDAGHALREAGIAVPTLIQLEQMLTGSGYDKAAQGGNQGSGPHKVPVPQDGKVSRTGEVTGTREVPMTKILQRFDVRVRLLLLLAGAIGLFLFTDPRYTLIVALAVLGIALLSRLPLARFRMLFLTLLPMFIMIGIFTGFTTPVASFQHPENRLLLATLRPNMQGGLSLGGVLLSLTFLLRVFSLVLLSSLLTWTASLEELLHLLKALKLPDTASFVIVTALRFIPAIDQKRKRILEAQSARGAHFQGRGMAGKIRAYLPLMVPLLINGILMADTLAIAMLNRGFGYSRRVQETERRNLVRRDYAAFVILILLTAGAVYLRFGQKLGTL